MIKAIESGIPKLHIEEAAARRQAMIDKGDEVIVGVNKYQLEEEEELEILEVDNSKVLNSQIKRLKQLKKERNEEKVKEALSALKEYAKTGKGNSLELSVNAARERCTVGEMTGALEEVWGRYKAQTQVVSNVYGSAFNDDESWKEMQESIIGFEKKYGRRPRILVAKMGQDGHDRGSKVVATAYADAGFDVDISPLFSTPQEVAKQAIENDVHAIGISSLAAGHKTLVPELLDELKKQKAGDIVVVCGGVIPKQDYDFLKKRGVKAIYGPGSPIINTVQDVLGHIKRNIK